MAMSLSHCRLCGRFVRYLYTVSGQYTRKSIQIHPSSVQRQFTSSSIFYCKNEDSDNVKSSESVETKASSTERKTEKTESEIKSKKVNQTSKTNRRKKKVSQEVKDSDEIYNKMESAAKDVASSLKQKGTETEFELLKMLRKHRNQKEDGGRQYDKGKSQEMDNALRSMISGMTQGKTSKQKIDQREINLMNLEDEITGFDTDKKRRPGGKHSEEFSDYELFPGKGLKIFAKGKDYPFKAKDDHSLWAKLEREESENLQYDYIPYNAFDEMILLTRENKLWKFPVDNEEGMEAEQEVPFYDHIFLEDLIQDFPKKGPIRNFMELVIVGLSKNPYLTVREKMEHIDWFRNYFSEREDILKEALGDDGLIRKKESSKDSSVESEV